MTDLDVAVRLKLVNLLSKEAKVAAKDLAGVGAAVGKLDGKATTRFAGELGKAWTASTKLGGSLEKTAAAAGKVDGKTTARFAGELGKAWTASTKLGGSLEKVAAAAGEVESKATARFAGELGKAWTASTRLGGSLEKVAAAAGKVEGKATARFAGELGKAWTASTKLGGSLEKVAAAAGAVEGKATARFVGELGKAWTASAKLGGSLEKVAAAAGKVEGKATARFAGELGKAWTESMKLGGSLDKAATAAGKAAIGVNGIGGASSGIDRTRRSVEQLTKANIALGMSQKKLVSANMIAGMSRNGAGGGSGALAAGAAGYAVGRRGKGAGREALAEAASRISPNGYLIGAGGARIAGAAIGGGTVAAAAGGGLAVREAIKFERAMADVQKKVDLDAGATWADVEMMINRASRDLGMSRGDMAALTAVAGQAGVAYKDLASFMRLAAKASVAWDVAPKEAANQLAKIKAQTGWTIPQLAEFADKINSIGDASASSEKDALEMFSRSAAAAKTANVPLDTTLAITTALNSIGMQEEVASRFVNAMSSKLRMATELPDKAQEGFKMLGLSAKTVEAGMQKDATKTILDILDRLEKSPDKAKAAVKIFGQEWWDEAARAGQALQEIVRLLQLIHGTSWKGSVDRNMEIDLATTDNHLKRTGALVSEIGDRLGRWSLPPVNEALDAFAQRLERIDESQRRAALSTSILGKGVNDALTGEEARRLASDKELQAKVAQQREAERKELEAARLKRDRLAVQTSSARAAGSGSLANVPAMVAETRKLDAQIAYLERRVETVKAKAAEMPKERHEGLRGAFGKADPKRVEELHNKLRQLDGSMKSLDLFPNSEEARQKAQGLVQELTSVFQRADLTPEARKVIDSYASGIAAQGGRVGAEAEAIRARLQQILGAPIVVKIEPRLSGARGVGGATGPAGGGSSSGAGSTPKKSSALPSGDVHIKEAHFHGVRDVAGLHRSVMAAADRRARSARDNALHDIDAG